MKTLRFYKEYEGGEGRWYIDLPGYLDMKRIEPSLTVSKADLEMVLGADKFLDQLSGNKDEVTLLVSTENSEIRDYEGLPAYAKHQWEWLSRADYVPTFSGKYYTGYNSQYMWLCPVTMFVFGTYPQYIYYKVVKPKENEHS